MDWMINLPLIVGKKGEVRTLRFNPKVAFQCRVLLGESPNDRCTCNRMKATIVGFYVNRRKQHVREVKFDDLVRAPIQFDDLDWTKPGPDAIRLDIRFEEDGVADLEMFGVVRLT